MEHPLNIKCVTTTTDSDGSIYGKFVIEPLERGYGTTLGNSLRRILLSSLEGTAITSVRFEGVTHEFTTIPGVVEDVLDIMLNMKGIVLKSNAHSSEAHSLTLSVDKPGPVLAGDIETPADVKVVNPGWLICHMSEGGTMNAEITCENGKGYVPADQTLAARSVDNLALDAAFMPIRRVAYTVEDTRVGQRTDYDKLIIEIWSNGSIDVSSALSQAANLMIEHLVPIASLSGIPTIVTQTLVEEAKSEQQVPNITIEDLELSVRAFNCLKRANIHNINDLLLKSELDLLNIKNFGKKSSDEVIERLRAFGLELKPNPIDAEYPMESEYLS
jgi:DNA-directed RNA polymerase subunit alpha